MPVSPSGSAEEMRPDRGRERAEHGLAVGQRDAADEMHDRMRVAVGGHGVPPRFGWRDLTPRRGPDGIGFVLQNSRYARTFRPGRVQRRISAFGFVSPNSQNALPLRPCGAEKVAVRWGSPLGSRELGSFRNSSPLPASPPQSGGEGNFGIWVRSARIYLRSPQAPTSTVELGLFRQNTCRPSPPCRDWLRSAKNHFRPSTGPPSPRPSPRGEREILRNDRL